MDVLLVIPSAIRSLMAWTSAGYLPSLGLRSTVGSGLSEATTFEPCSPGNVVGPVRAYRERSIPVAAAAHSMTVAASCKSVDERRPPRCWRRGAPGARGTGAKDDSLGDRTRTGPRQERGGEPGRADEP